MLDLMRTFSISEVQAVQIMDIQFRVVTAEVRDRLRQEIDAVRARLAPPR